MKLWLRGRPGRQLCTGPKDHRFLRSAAGAGKTGGPASRSALTCPKVATIIITGAGRKTGTAGDGSRCIAALRWRCPAKPGRALPCVPQGTMLASSRKPCAAARLRGGRNRPPYIAAGSGRRYTTGSPHQAQRRADEIIGPYAGGSTPRPSSACHSCCPRFRRPFALHCRAGVHARRKSLRRPGRILARPGAAPLSRLCRQLPLQGSLSDGSLPKASPARGGGCAARRSRRGALLPCGGGVLRSRAGPCPVFRRGRSPC